MTIAITIKIAFRLNMQAQISFSTSTRADQQDAFEHRKIEFSMDNSAFYLSSVDSTNTRQNKKRRAHQRQKVKKGVKPAPAPAKCLNP